MEGFCVMVGFHFEVFCLIQNVERILLQAVLKESQKLITTITAITNAGLDLTMIHLNELFEMEISKLEYNPIIKDLMKEILLDNYKQFTYDIELKRKSISKEIRLLHDKVCNARDKYLSDKLDEEDYKEIKMLTKTQIEQLELELQHIVSESKELDIKTKIENALESMETFQTFTSRAICLQKERSGV